MDSESKAKTLNLDFESESKAKTLNLDFESTLDSVISILLRFCIFPFLKVVFSRILSRFSVSLVLYERGERGLKCASVGEWLCHACEVVPFPLSTSPPTPTTLFVGASHGIFDWIFALH